MKKPWLPQGLIAIALACPNLNATVIQMSDHAGPLERFAAKEIRRYIYVRTDTLLPIQTGNEITSDHDMIVIGLKGQSLIGGRFGEQVGNLEPQEYLIKTGRHSGRSVLWIVGGDAVGLLYGSYRFAETLGVRFYMHGDTIPDQKIPVKIPDLDIKGKPLFNLRGVLPFHDFPEGPDWWNLEDTKAVIAQLPKLGMNFIGFHTYPERLDFNGEGYRAEPMTWIGPKEDIQSDGTVRSGYPNLHFNTADHTWGYSAMRTSQFSLGAGQLFERDNFGPDHMAGKAPWPHKAQENIETFNDFGKLLKQAFSFARRLGVKTCIGTETFLTIPLDVQVRLRAQGKNPDDPAVIQSMYEGMFERIKRTHPLDYYWMWTPESWTWQDVPNEDVTRTEKDMLLAVAAAEKVKAPFTLATCGWVLGPPKDRAQFDRVLPKEMPFSCINRGVGFTPVEPGFANVKGRPKWAIPWLEDDPALISPQLWVGRMRKDAVEALTFGCTGLIGINWRTRILGPNVNALAKAGWEQGAWSRANVSNGQRDLPVEDYYQDWALSQFGPEAAVQIAAIFSRLDGGPLNDVEGPHIADLYRTSTWIQGPGAIRTINEPWEEVNSRFDFVNKLVALRRHIRGAGNLERFDYWLNTMRFAKATARVGCTLGELAALSEEVKKTPNPAQKKQMVLGQALPLRQQLYEQWETMTNWLLLTVTNPSELGTIANLEQHNRRRLNLLTSNDHVFARVLNRPLPTLQLPMDYRGPTRIIVPSLRTSLEADEDLNLKVLILGSEHLAEATLYWRPLGNQSYQPIPLAHVTRSVYKVQVPAKQIQGRDFEYYIQAAITSKQAALYPASAPRINQTVVILE